MAQIYQAISMAAFSIAASCLIFALFCWFKFGIWKIIGDLSGRNAKKSIEQMRAENEKSGNKTFRPTPVAVKRGPLTETMPGMKKENTIPLSPKDTALFSEENTVPLSPKDTVLFSQENTVPLSQEDTAPLFQERRRDFDGQYADGFTMLENIVLVHTGEVIKSG